MENKNYYVYGIVDKIEKEIDSSYVTFRVVQSSKKYLVDLKKIGVPVSNFNVKLSQKVLIVFNAKTNDVLNYFTIE